MSRGTGFQHFGNKSVAMVPNTEGNLERLDELLGEYGFHKTAAAVGELEWKRSGSFVWWPSRVSVEERANELVISAQMYLPWVSVLIPIVLLAAAAPFLPDVVLVTCASVLGVCVLIVGAVPRLRRFDLSPYAYWQGLGRRVWGRRLEGVIREVCSRESCGLSGGNGEQEEE